MQSTKRHEGRVDPEITVKQLSRRELGRLRGAVCEEFVNAYLGDAPPDVLAELSTLWRAIDARLGRRADGPPATLARRAQIEVERRTYNGA